MKVLIDGVEVQEPNGIKGLTQEIQFVNEYRGLFTLIPFLVLVTFMKVLIFEFFVIYELRLLSCIGVVMTLLDTFISVMSDMSIFLQSNSYCLGIAEIQPPNTD